MSGNHTDLLRQSQVFARLSDPELRKVSKLLKERRLGRNQLLFRQGEPADSMYVIVAGRIRISAADQTGHEKVLAFAGVGEIVGEMGLLSGEARSATAVASTEVTVAQLRKADFDVLLANSVDLMRDLVRVVAGRSEATHQRTMDEAGGGEGYRHGLVTTVFSPRGGAGTSTIATNLAVALAQHTPDRVILLDLNVLFSHVPVLLNVTPRTSLAAISAGSVRQMDRESLEFYLTTHTESSLRVLCGALRPEDSELVTGEHVRSVVELLRRQFVHVIVDLSRGFSELNITAIEAAHNLLVVCTPDRVGVRGVVESQRILRELLRLPGDPLQYVLNHPSPYAALSAEQLGEMLHIRPLISIPFGGDAPARAALEGQPLVTRFPNSPTSKPIVSLATKLEQQLTEARAVASHASLPLKGLLRRSLSSSPSNGHDDLAYPRRRP